MPSTGARKDPFLGCRFLVEVEGIRKAGFREVSGLDAAIDSVDYREGDDPTMTISKLSALKKWTAITFSRGVTDDRDLWNWCKQVMDGKIKDARKSGAIVLRDDEGNEAARWEFREAWPGKCTGPTFNATSNDVAIEKLELNHEGLDRIK